MSMIEVKEAVAEMSLDQRLEIAALIAHLNRSTDSDYLAELDRRMEAMEAGQKISATTLRHKHLELLDEGR